MPIESGDFITPDDFQGQLDFLQSQIDNFTAGPACRATRASDQAITIATLTPVVLNGTSTWDYGGCHPSSDSQVQNPGDRGLCSGVAGGTWEPYTAGYRNFYIQVNSSTTIAIDFRDGIAGTSNGVSIPWDFLLDNGDYVELLAYYDIDIGDPGYTTPLQLGHCYITLERYRDAA